MKRSVCYILAVCAVLAGCMRMEENGLVSRQEIRFTATVGAYQVKATDTAFEAGDAIGLSAFEPVNITNVKLTYSDGTLQSGKSLYWGRGQRAGDESWFAAYYPFHSGWNFAEGIDFTVQPDQSTHAGYTASDFMVAYGPAKPADEVVNLNFSHSLTKVVLQINDTLEEEISEVYMGNLLGRAEIFPEDMTVKGSLGTIKAGAVDLNDGGEGWVLITMPQMARPKLMVTTTGGKQYTYTVEEEFELLSGHCHHAHITIDENSIATDFTSDVTEWVDDSDIQFKRPSGLTHFQEVFDAEDGTVFTVSGTVTEIMNMNYGNYYLEDEDGNSLYIYGTLNNAGLYPRKLEYGWYSEPFGFVPGDVVTVTGPKLTYNGQVELVDVKVDDVNRVPFGMISDAFGADYGASTMYVLVRAEDLSKVHVVSTSDNWVQVKSFENAGMPMATWRYLVFEAEANPTFQQRMTTVDLTYYEDENAAPAYRKTVEFWQDGRPAGWSIIGDIEGMYWDADIDLIQLNDGTWYGFFYYEQGQEFVLRVNHEWDYSLRLPGDMSSMDDWATLTEDSGSGNNIRLQQGTGIYELYLDVERKELKLVPLEESWSLIGAIKGTVWDTDFVMQPCVVNVDGASHAAVRYVLQYNEGEQFKFRHDRDWEFNLGGTYTNASSSDILYQALTPGMDYLLERGGPNLGIDGEGVYDVRFTFYNKSVQALSTQEEPWADPEPEPEFQSWSIIGTVEGLGWGKDIDMMQMPDGRWYGFFYYGENDQFVLRTNHNWNYSLHMPTDMDSINGTVTLWENGDNILLGSPGVYEVYLNPDNNEATIVPMGESWGMIGSINNSTWDTDFILRPETIAVEGVDRAAIHYVLDYHAGEEFKLRHGRDWNFNLGGAEYSLLTPNVAVEMAIGGANFQLEEDGVYDIIFSFYDKKLTAVPSQEEPWAN